MEEGEFLSTPLLAIQLLGELRDTEAVPLLIARLTVEFARTADSDADRFTPAAQALAKIGGDAVEALLDVAAGGNDEEWSQAAGSLELMGTPELVRQAAAPRIALGVESQELVRLQELVVRLH